MCSAEPHPANCLTDLKKKKKISGRKNSQSQSWPFTQGKEITKGASFFKMQDFNHDLQTVASFSKYSRRWADVVSFTLLYSELCLALYHFTVFLLRMSGSTESERKAGMLAQPQWMVFFVGGGGQKREGGLLDRRGSLEPQKLSDWARQPEVFLKSAGVSFNSIRNKLELLSNYRNICSQYVNLIVLKLLLS